MKGPNLKKVEIPVPEDVKRAITKRGRTTRPRLSESEQNALKQRIRTADAVVTPEEELAISQAAENDPDNLPAELRRRGRPSLPPSLKRRPVTIKLDPRIIAHFKGANEKGWHKRLNEALLEIIEES